MDLDSLYEAARSRDPTAWEALGRGLSVELRRFFGRCFDRNATEDLVQITALVVMRKFDEFRPAGPTAFRNWVFAIAARQARAYAHEPRREQARRNRLQECPDPTPMHSPGAELLRRERLALIAECLARLPAEQRRAIESDLEGDDARSLADREGISVGGARVRRHRALARLRELLVESRPRPRTSAHLQKL